VGLLDQVLQQVAGDAGGTDGQLGLDAEAGGDLADADLPSDARIHRQSDLLLAGDELQRPEKAGRVSGGEQLLGIGPGTTGAAQLARRGQLHVERLVGGAGAAFAAAGGGGSSGVENLLDGHGGDSCFGLPERCCPVSAILLSTKNYW